MRERAHSPSTSRKKHGVRAKGCWLAGVAALCAVPSQAGPSGEGRVRNHDTKCILSRGRRDAGTPWPLRLRAPPGSTARPRRGMPNAAQGHAATRPGRVDTPELQPAISYSVAQQLAGCASGGSLCRKWNVAVSGRGRAYEVPPARRARRSACLGLVGFPARGPARRRAVQGYAAHDVGNRCEVLGAARRGARPRASRPKL